MIVLFVALYPLDRIGFLEMFQQESDRRFVVVVVVLRVNSQLLECHFYSVAQQILSEHLHAVPYSRCE